MAVPSTATRVALFCPKCLAVDSAAARCGCGVKLQPLMDTDGALSKAFLAARGSCCDSGCRNCPYDEPQFTNGVTVPNALNACNPINGVTALAKSKKCERCGSKFDCGMGACWCGELKLAEATLLELRTGFADCLCPQCLREIDQQAR